MTKAVKKTEMPSTESVRCDGYKGSITFVCFVRVYLRKGRKVVRNYSSGTKYASVLCVIQTHNSSEQLTLQTSFFTAILYLCILTCDQVLF